MSSIKTLKISNYRNYRDSSFNFLPNINIVYGKNGAGKTNILESISMLSAGKGILNANVENISRVGDSCNWSVFATLNDEIIDTVNVYIDENKKKKIKINGNFVRTQDELNEIFSMIWITPQMQNFFIDDKAIRRKFLDKCVYLIDFSHAKRIAKYEYYLKERIKVLLSKYDKNWLNTLENKIVEVSNEIILARNNIINILNNLSYKYDFSFPKFQLSINNGEFNNLKEILLQNRQKDFETKRTNDGVHKSDFKLFYQTKNMFAEFCSTGEQKLFLISLTLLKAFICLEYKKGSPIILLDEVFSYLDVYKKQDLFKELNKLKIQTFITTTDIDIFKDLINENVNLISIK